jgi:hypothetical protein
MEAFNRRAAIGTFAAGAVVAGKALAGTSADDERAEPKLWTLEGQLKEHPKFLYRYYLALLGTGQICALYGADHGREPEALKRLKLPIAIRVRGVLGTAYHDGGRADNPSPFPAGWTLYMDVHEVETLKIDLEPRPEPGPRE